MLGRTGFLLALTFHTGVRRNPGPVRASGTRWLFAVSRQVARRWNAASA